MNERHHGLGQGIGFAIFYALMSPFIAASKVKDVLTRKSPKKQGDAQKETPKVEEL